VKVKSAWVLARCDVVVVEVASEQGKEEGGKWEGNVEAKQRHGDSTAQRPVMTVFGLAS